MSLAHIFNLPSELTRKVELARNARPTREAARLALDCLDLTSLSGNETTDEIFDLCDTAKHNRLYSVCLYPAFVATAQKALKSGPVVIATVINFPHGDRRTLCDEKATPQTIKEDVSAAIAAGARQIDIVLAHDLFRDGRAMQAKELLKACRMAIPQGVQMKVIIESAAFQSSLALRGACRLAIECGADCLKTSTGKHEKGGADLERAAILMDEAAKSSRHVGVKISGGVKTTQQAAQYIALARSVMGWNSIQPMAFRIGGSTLLQPLLDTLRYTPSPGVPVPANNTQRPGTINLT